MVTSTRLSTSKVDPELCRAAHKFAASIVRDFDSYSNILDREMESSIPEINRNEVVLGPLLGSGGFNDVYQLDRVGPPSSDNAATAAANISQTLCEEQERRRDALGEDAKNNKLAIKFLRRDTMKKKQDFCNAAADLIVETKILSNLKSHPNIIQLHAVAQGGAAAFAEGTEGCYFLVIDRLQENLQERIQKWKESKEPLVTRVNVALEISSALKHLHNHNIVFRDLKPDNIGFDMNGTIKLFDFGLAKELNPRELKCKETYEMSGQTGSRRFMAPEVALSEPYGLAADVYSFAIVFWSLLSLKDAFDGMTTEDHFRLVVLSHERPSLDPSWPVKILNIMKWCWTRDPLSRPPMYDVRKALKRQIRTLLEEENKDKKFTIQMVTRQRMKSTGSVSNGLKTSATSGQNDDSTSPVFGSTPFAKRKDPAMLLASFGDPNVSKRNLSSILGEVLTMPGLTEEEAT